MFKLLTSKYTLAIAITSLTATTMVLPMEKEIELQATKLADVYYFACVSSKCVRENKKSSKPRPPNACEQQCAKEEQQISKTWFERFMAECQKKCSVENTRCLYERMAFGEDCNRTLDPESVEFRGECYKRCEYAFESELRMLRKS